VDKALVTAVVLLLVALAITGMVVAWRKQVSRDRRFQILLPGSTNSDHQSSPLEFSGLYVATTLALDPLQRITLPGLAFRADAHLLVSQSGVTIAPRGEKSTFIPSDQIVQIHRTQVTIDKAVEKDGLSAISWSGWDTTSQEQIEFTSYFRFSIPEVRLACENALTSHFPHATSTSKEVAS
jgi:hypothetical protein